MDFNGDFSKIFEQIQNISQKAEEIKKGLDDKEVIASVGGQMVTIKATASGKVTDVKIDPSLVNTDKIDVLQDLIKVACNEANRLAKEEAKSEMSKLTGGIPIPPGFM